MNVASSTLAIRILWGYTPIWQRDSAKNAESESSNLSIPINGTVAKWKGGGLQLREQVTPIRQFESVQYLHTIT